MAKQPSSGIGEHIEQNANLQFRREFRPEVVFEWYGLLENPFGVTPDSRYLYLSSTHAEARSSLIIGVEFGLGFQALIAPPGMGKTTILFDVLERFNNVARTAFLFQIHGDSRDLLRSLISELEGESHDPDLDLMQMQDAINQLLIREHRAGRRTIIIIDEAQTLDSSVLETIRLLSNFETPSEKLAQVILAGQPRLAQKLANPKLTQLRQRISLLRTLMPLQPEDMRRYIEHRLKIAGYRGVSLFTPAAIKLIWENSKGIPREINTICFNALLLAAAVGRKQVDDEVLQEVIADCEPVGIIPSSNILPKQKLTRPDMEAAIPKNVTAPPVGRDTPIRTFPPVHVQSYNLYRNPFDAAPDTSFLCFTKTHTAALAILYCGIAKGQGVMLLTGQAGTGKSLVAACLLELFKNGHVQARYGTAEHLVRMGISKFLSAHFGLVWSQAGGRFDAELATCSDAGHVDPLQVMLIDEAQDLSIHELREIQLLVKLQKLRPRVPQIVLIGRPEVGRILSSAEFRELKALIAVHHQISPLDEAETEKYIAGRLQLAQADSRCEPIFSDDAVSLVCHHSAGIPRFVNRLCESALITGHASGQSTITSHIIENLVNHPRSEAIPQENIRQIGNGETNEILKAAKVLLECHIALNTGAIREAPNSKAI